MLLAAVSVDLDEIPNYYAIHGLNMPAGAGATAVYDLALGRLDDWARAVRVPLTLFAIGSDMERPDSARRLRFMVERGHEVANHTQSHFYDFSRRGRAVIRSEVERAIHVLEEATGARPTGFRAPGYTITDEVYDVLEDLGVRYGSSVFPCPLYYGAKATALARMRISGRRSQSILDTPNVLRAPIRPYRVGRPYWKPGGGLLEIPVQVTRRTRLPFIGWTLTLAGVRGARFLTRGVVGEPLVNLELHGTDVLDASDGFEELRGVQPDAAIPHADKIDTLTVVVEALREAGYSFVRHDEAASYFSGAP